MIKKLNTTEHHAYSTQGLAVAINEIIDWINKTDEKIVNNKKFKEI